MKTLTIVGTATLLSMACLAQAADQLGFVFELTRHGARAPTNDEEPG